MLFSVMNDIETACPGMSTGLVVATTTITEQYAKRQRTDERHRGVAHV